MSGPEPNDDADADELRARLAAMTAERDKWKGLSRKHETQAKENKDHLDTLRAEIAKSARRAALLAGSAQSTA